MPSVFASPSINTASSFGYNPNAETEMISDSDYPNLGADLADTQNALWPNTCPLDLI